MDFLPVNGGKTALNLARIDSASLLPDEGIAISVGANVFCVEPGHEADRLIKHFGLKKPKETAEPAEEEHNAKQAVKK